MKLSNPIQEVLNNIPEINNIKDTQDNIQILTISNWHKRLKTIQTKNLNKYGTSTTNIEIYFNPCIVCIYDDGTLEINTQKYKLIYKYVTSEKNHK